MGGGGWASLWRVQFSQSMPFPKNLGDRTASVVSVGVIAPKHENDAAATFPNFGPNPTGRAPSLRTCPPHSSACTPARGPWLSSAHRLPMSRRGGELALKYPSFSPGCPCRRSTQSLPSPPQMALGALLCNTSTTFHDSRVCCSQSLSAFLPIESQGKARASAERKCPPGPRTA